MKWILAVWFCGISAMADAQVTESLKAIGMENIRCAQTPGVTTVSFENNVYRSTYTGVGKAIDACLGSETKGDLQLVVLENRIPRLCINLPDTLTEAYRNGEINLTQVYQQMGITVDTDPAMKALKNAGQEEVPSAWKMDLVIYPDLFLENNTFDELYTYAINLNPAVEMALWKGGKMTAQVILPVATNLSGEMKRIRPGIIALSQDVRFRHNIFGKMTVGKLYQQQIWCTTGNKIPHQQRTLGTGRNGRFHRFLCHHPGRRLVYRQKTAYQCLAERFVLRTTPQLAVRLESRKIYLR